MNILAFDTSTENLSIALSTRGQRYSSDSEGGAKASRSLLAKIHALLEQARLRSADLNLIAFGAGPGSFTGLRTACAAAQGLAYAHNIQVLPISCLLATAQQAFNTTQNPFIQVVLDARMTEVYSAQYQLHEGVWLCQQAAHTVAPELLVPASQALIAGNAYAVYEASWQLPQAHFYALPSALAMLDLVPNLLAQGAAIEPHLAVPHYVRDKVALSTAERLAKAAQ
jgi:tRNA threonylcarbamoyladenosine biosynthesis protein TsaB